MNIPRETPLLLLLRLRDGSRRFYSEPIPPIPPTFLSMILLLSAVAVMAGYIPARRASRIDSMLALRGE